MQRHRGGGLDRRAVHHRAVGRSQILDLKRFAGQEEARVATRDRGVRDDELAERNRITREKREVDGAGAGAGGCCGD